MAVFIPNTAKFCTYWIVHNIAFTRKTQFFVENTWTIIADNSDHNIDPRLSFHSTKIVHIYLPVVDR
jgi:hypothetical protein